MASGNLLARWNALDNEPPSTSYATRDEIVAATGLRPVLDFDSAADEVAVFSGVLPANYAGGGFTLKLHGAMDSANAGGETISIDAAFELVDNNFALGAAGSDFAAANNSGAVAVDATANDLFIVTITFTDGADSDSIAANKAYRLKITRDADSTTAADNAAGDWQLLEVVLTET